MQVQLAIAWHLCCRMLLKVHAIQASRVVQACKLLLPAGMHVGDAGWYIKIWMVHRAPCMCGCCLSEKRISVSKRAHLH